MNDFITILDNHRELLQERGYDEIGLGSPDEPGLFMKKLEYLFSECIRKAQYNNEKQDFFIESFGFFDNDKDMIAFRFHYEFNPHEKDIVLKSLAARMDDSVKIFLFARNTYELPYALRVHRILCDERRKAVIQSVNQRPDIEKMTNEQDELLRKIGYYDTSFATPPQFIRNELKSELEKIVSYPSSEIQHINISRYIHFDQYEFIHCLFHYQYNPLNKTLHLGSITAKKDEIEKNFSIDNTMPAISLRQIHENLKEAERLGLAKEIAGHIQNKSYKKRM